MAIDRGVTGRWSSNPNQQLQDMGYAEYIPGVNWDMEPRDIYDARREAGVADPNLNLIQTGGNDVPNEYAAIIEMFNTLYGAANEATAAQNQTQLQMVREANALTASQAELTRKYNSAEAEKAFLRSEQSRLATQEYNTGERLASQEYNTSERLASQEYNTSERLASQDWQEYMSGSQYQRAVKDLYAAGLNPLLAVGAQASYGNVSPGRSSGAYSSGASSSPTRSSAASSSSTSYHSAQAYRTNVESILNGVLSYMTNQRQLDISEMANTFGFFGKLVSAIF